MTADKTIVLALRELTNATQKSNWEIGLLALGAAIGVGTFIVLVIYTVETKRLRKAAQKQIAVTEMALKSTRDQADVSTKLLQSTLEQNELTGMPILVCLIDVDGNCILKNTGKGVALNILIDSVEDLPNIAILRFTPYQRALTFGENTSFQFEFITNTMLIRNVSDEKFLTKSLGEFGLSSIPINVRCKSITGQSYTFLHHCFVNYTKAYITFAEYTMTPGTVG